MLSRLDDASKGTLPLLMTVTLQENVGYRLKCIWSLSNLAHFVLVHILQRNSVKPESEAISLLRCV